MNGAWRFLIGIISDRANVPIAGFRFLGSEKIAKRTAVDSTSRFVNYTAINKDSFRSIQNILINRIGVEIVHAENKIHSCSVIWRKERRIGVAFY
jgi:hypothetical protein